MKVTLILAVFLCISASAIAEQFAVLVAGSSGYYNYRHQADVCHAYQVLIKNGVPAKNIITMMYDDVANSTMNPTKGVIINQPGGEDVYGGVVKDYVRSDVTPENFLKVISGDAAGMKGIGSGKVLQSGPNDHVFINFVDHGAPGLLGFPMSELYARDLQKTLLKMHENKMYAKLVMYIEACESGSMFEDLLPNNLNIFVTTAANAKESSYACYYDDERGTYLGDEYSVNWMEDSDSEDLSQETLSKQFTVVKKETSDSHVQEYGDLTMGSMKVSDFQGNGKKDQDVAAKKMVSVSPKTDAVPSGEVPWMILQNKLTAATTIKERIDLKRQILDMAHKREFLINKLKQIVLMATKDDEAVNDHMTKKTKLTEFDCYEELVKTFSRSCFQLSKNEYAYRQLFVLVNLCQSSIGKENVLEAMNVVCSEDSEVVGII